MPLNKNLPRKNQMIYSRNLREELYNRDLESLSDEEMFSIYSKIWIEEQTSNKLEFIRFEDDTSGGPYMPSCIFKHRDYNGEFMVTNSGMGISFCLNPGPKYKKGLAIDFGLDKRDMNFIWECFNMNQKRECDIWHN